MSVTGLELTISEELKYFDSDEQRLAFQAKRIVPRQYDQTWQYGSETHLCTIVASDGVTEIVHCSTGFGPSFPWRVQEVGATELGTDGEWHAYLYEAFVTSSMWPEGPPLGFELTGPGEREEWLRRR